MVDELLEAQRLAARLRRTRLERGLSLRGAAAKIGVTKETLSDLERARRHPHPPTLAKIAAGYDVDISDLLGPMVEGEPVLSGKGEAPSPPPEKSEEERRSAGDREGTQTPILEDVRRVLEEQVGTSWLALPEEEWREWWRWIPQEEAHKRREQIREEWEFLKLQFAALHEGKPSLLPRSALGGGVFLTLWARARMEAPESVTARVNEPEQAFKRRQWEDRTLEWTEVKHPQEEDAADEASGAEAG